METTNKKKSGRGRKAGDVRLRAQAIPGVKGFQSYDTVLEPDMLKPKKVEVSGLAPSARMNKLQDILSEESFNVVNRLLLLLAHDNPTIRLRAAEQLGTWFKHVMPQVKELRSSEQRYGELPPPDWD